MRLQAGKTKAQHRLQAVEHTLFPYARRHLFRLTRPKCIIVCIKMAAVARNRQIYELWRDIQDIIGNARLWPYRIRALFWKQGVKHFERILLVTFVLVNGLNPEVFMEWVDLVNLCNNTSARRHFEALFRLLPERNYTLYAYNVTNNRYEYLDGRVRRYVHASRRDN